MQIAGKAVALGAKKKRFFVLTGTSLCYYDKLCNSEGESSSSHSRCGVFVLLRCALAIFCVGLAPDGGNARLHGMVILSDAAMPEGRRCKVKAKGCGARLHLAS